MHANLHYFAPTLPTCSILCIRPCEILTQDPAQGLRATNRYSISTDSDVDGVSVGPGPEEFTLR